MTSFRKTTPALRNSTTRSTIHHRLSDYPPCEFSSPAGPATSAATRSGCSSPRPRCLGLRQPLARPSAGRAGRPAHRRRPARRRSTRQAARRQPHRGGRPLRGHSLRRRVGDRPGEVLHEQPRQHAQPARPLPPHGVAVRLLQHLRDLRHPRRVPITEDETQAPINPYGNTKLAVERALADYAARLPLGLLRPALLQRRRRQRPTATIGEDHDPETHLIPLVLQAATGPAAARRHLRHRLPDARRHLRSRLHPRR